MPVPLLLAAASAAPALVHAGFQIADRLQADPTPKPSSSNPSSPGAPPRARAPGRARARGLPKLDAEQQQAVAAIAAELQATTLPGTIAASRPALLLALIANAHAESGLRPAARNQTGREDSVGLFQANRSGGLGTGHTVQQLIDPRFNTRLLLREIARQGARFEQLLQAGATIPQLTAAVTLWVERPANPSQRARERAETIATWFPQLAAVRALSWAS